MCLCIYKKKSARRCTYVCTHARTAQSVRLVGAVHVQSLRDFFRLLSLLCLLELCCSPSIKIMNKATIYDETALLNPFLYFLLFEVRECFAA